MGDSTDPHCFIGAEKYLDAVINSDYRQKKFTRGHKQTLSRFEYLTKEDTSQPYIPRHDFITNNVNAADANTDDMPIIRLSLTNV